MPALTQDALDGEEDEAEVQKKEIQAVHDKLAQEFGASEFASAISGVAPEDAAHEIGHFLNSANDYFGLDARDLEPRDLHEMLFDVLPRKFSFPEEFFQQLPLILHAFLKFMEAGGYLKETTRRQRLFQLVDTAKTRLPVLAADPRNWGMAKSMFMSGREAGYDISNPADIAKFTIAYNASLLSSRAAALPPEPEVDSDYEPSAPLVPILRQSPKVGRNDPCPCGSGKKYKKCCG